MINWTQINDSVGQSSLRQFAVGEMSGRSLLKTADKVGVKSEVDSVLREHGVTYARRLARKALRRRGVQI